MEVICFCELVFMNCVIFFVSVWMFIWGLVLCVCSIVCVWYESVYDRNEKKYWRKEKLSMVSASILCFSYNLKMRNENMQMKQMLKW